MLGFNRRYVVALILLALALLAVTYAIHNAAELRLAQSTQRVQSLLRRQILLSELMQLVVDAEKSQRDYMLTGDVALLQPYQAALAQREPTFTALRTAYRDANPQLLDKLSAIELPMADRFGELAIAVKLQQTTSRDAAAAFIRARVTTRTMVQIRDSVEALRALESSAVPAMVEATQRDLLLTRVITASGLLVNALLVVLAGWLIGRNIGRRVAGANQLLLENTELQTLVAERTADLTALSDHLQTVQEREKSALANELHDELGGLLVAAKMDVTWLRRRHGTADDDDRNRWERVLSSLDAGVDLKRRVVEQLRPTLLDNMGLFTALRWQLQDSCERAGLHCTDEMPEQEMSLDTDAAIAIFRIAQEAMTNILKHARATKVELRVVVTDQHMVMTIRDNGVGLPAVRVRSAGAHGLLSMRHRVQAWGGTCALSPGIDGMGTQVQVQMPRTRIQAAGT